MEMKYKVGVFDSGVGGLSVANAIESSLPNVEVLYVDDKEHVPYGNKTVEEVYHLVKPKLQQLVEQNCQVIVIACNTVTTTMIKKLREESPIPLIGMEPMVKSAASQTHTGTIAVCATPATLRSERYGWLKETFARNIVILEPDCSQWSSMIESNQIDHEFINNQIRDVCDKNADVIVLGCTHYHWIEDEIRQAAAGRALVLQPEQPVIRRLTRVLQDIKPLN